MHRGTEAVEQRTGACWNTSNVCSEPPSDKIDAFFFAPDTTRWELVRIGAGHGGSRDAASHWAFGQLRSVSTVTGDRCRAGRPWTLIHWPGFLFLLNSDPTWIWRIYAVTCIMALFLAVGLWTRVAAIATWFLYVATIQRNLISFNGETGILAFVLLGLAFAPAPQRLSIDYLVLKRQLPMHGEVWPARFIQLKFA